MSQDEDKRPGDRIYGTETEYAIFWKRRNSEYVTDCLEKQLFGCFTVDSPRQTGTAPYLFNGGLIRLDNVSSVDYWDCTPEYATPECRSVRDVVRYEKAGEIMMRDIFDTPGREGGTFSLAKHCRGTYRDKYGLKEVSAGHHENYSTDKYFNSVFSSTSTESAVLLSFLVSRIIFSGAGWVGHADDGCSVFQLSPRVLFIDSEIGQDTTGNRSIICSKDEPLSMVTKRLHLVVGEHLMSELALFLVIGMTGLVLRMLEAGELLDAPLLSNPLDALRRFNRDPLLKIKVGLRQLPPKDQTERLSALEIQKYFCTQAEKFLDRNPATPEEIRIVTYWSDVIERLAHNPDLLIGELDWPTKKAIMNAFVRKNGWNWGDVVENKQSLGGIPVLDCLKDIDLAYHQICSSGLYNRLVETGRIKRLLTNTEIREAIMTPPADTRAKIRGEFLRLVADRTITGHVESWQSMRIETPKLPGDTCAGAIGIDDPFDFYCDKWQYVKGVVLKK